MCYRVIKLRSSLPRAATLAKSPPGLTDYLAPVQEFAASPSRTRGIMAGNWPVVSFTPIETIHEPDHLRHAAAAHGHGARRGRRAGQHPGRDADVDRHLP